MVARTKRYIRGKIYIINDGLVSHDGYRKKNRRVVALNNDKREVHIAKIKGLYRNDGSRRSNLIPIENYNALSKPSGIYPYVYKKTAKGQSIEVSKMKKTRSRLNKWDMKKILHLK